MIVFDSGDGLVLRDAWNFESLSFTTSIPPNAPISDGVQWLDDEHVVVGEKALRAMAGSLGSDPVWLKGFRVMLSYASSKGWVDDNGNIRIHVVRTGVHR